MKHVCAQQIIEDVLIQDSVENYRKSLQEIFMEWVITDKCYTPEHRSEVAYHYLALMEMLESVEAYKKKQ